MRHVMNFTDVDDKTINASQQAGVSLREYTDRYIEAYLEDAAAIGLEPVEENPRATTRPTCARWSRWSSARERGAHLHVGRIDLLPHRDAARVRQAGALDHEGHSGGARVDSDSYTKQDARDFVLWKATKPGEPTWDYGCGPGRPDGTSKFSHGAAAPWAVRLTPWRRHRSHLSASRERDRAGRGRNGPAVLTLLGHVEF
jgi:cysteinyl-tRNA synthetase